MAGTIVDRSGGVPLGRAWNSWSQDRPGEMTYLPIGASIAPFAFSAKSNAATLFAMSRSVRLGPRTVDASRAELELEHAGTRLSLIYQKPDPFAIRGDWNTLALGEWGARFWFGFALHGVDGDGWAWDEDGGFALLRIGPRFVAVACSPAPVVVTSHELAEDVAREFEEYGYSYTGSRGNAGPVLALRFSLEEGRTGAIAAAVGDDRGELLARMRAILAEPAASTENAVTPTHHGEFAGALDAVRDTIAWNTIWDGVNHRRHTSLSRNWSSRKFNGFGIWSIDLLYHALLGAVLDADLARENLSAVLAAATPQGNLACRITGNDAWLDRGNPPLGGFVVWTAYLRLNDRSLLEAAFDTLLRNFDWWWQNRDPKGLGLLSYGSSNAGTGIYNGTKFGAKNESSMDNSPIHDEFDFDAQCRTLNGSDIGLNSLFVLEAEMLSLMARELGLDAQGRRLAEFADAHRRRIRTQLWDPERNIFANRKWSGAFVRSLAPTSFYPMLAGIADENQIRHLLAALGDETLFGGPVGLPSVNRSDPAYQENVYWRGPVWPPLNFLVWQGLRRCGLSTEASELARRSYALFMDAWRSAGAVPENYDPVAGWTADQADTDWFYSWGALMPMMAVAALVDINPWNGWEICNEKDFELGPLTTPSGHVTVRSAGRILSVSRGEQVLMRTNVGGRITRIRLDDGCFSATLPPSEGPEEWMEFPASGSGILSATLGGDVLGSGMFGTEDRRLRLDRSPQNGSQTLAVIFG